MKLSQIYADKPFKKVVFNSGLNIVLAIVKKPMDIKKDSHNLGKSTLISVIDFLLLKNVNSDKKHLLNKFKSIFLDYTFYLEVLLNDGTYLTIKRSVNNNTKISFKSHKLHHQDYQGNVNWDELNLPLKRAISYLNGKIAFNVLENWKYRKSVSYFLRTQKDYYDVFQLNKFSIGKDKDWKPFLFDLLGFEGNLLTQKYTLEEDKDEQIDLITKVKKQFQIDPNEIDKIQGAIEIKKRELEVAQKLIDNFNFYQKERKINRELIDEIETEVSRLNTEEYEIEMELEKIKNSYENKLSFDIDELKQVYEETGIYFPEELSKNYEELVGFNKTITEERNQYLEKREKQLTIQIKKVRNQLESLNKDRNQYLSFLQDSNSFGKFKTYQKELAKIESEIARLEEQLKSIDNIDKLNDTVDDIKSEIKTTVENINLAIKKSNKLYSEVRKHFSNIINYILNAPAILYISTNTNNNVEYQAEIQRNNIITAESGGNTYQKILCAAFDLAILSAYSSVSFYKFVYHDGILESLDNRKRFSFITLVSSLCEKHNLQYIFTAIQDDIPKSLTGKLVTFSPEQICVTLHDEGDDGKLFMQSF